MEAEMNTKSLVPDAHTDTPSGSQARRRMPGATVIAGGFYLVMGGIHIGIVAADTATYRHFADGALLGFVRSGWSDLFMAHPATWGLLLAAGEITLGALLLTGGALARWGWTAVAAFQVLLMLFGWGFWLWSVPALAVIYLGARRDWVTLQ
jgi:hypothetical protein